MEFVSHTVSEPLAATVEALFHLRGYSPEDPIERIVPDGSANFVIELDDQVRYVLDRQTRKPRTTCVGSWFSGVQRNHIRVTVPAESELIAVRFAPGRAFPIVGDSLANYCDKVVAGTAIFGDAAVELRTALRAEPSAARRLELVEAFLLRRHRAEHGPPPSVVDAITMIAAHPTVKTLKSVREAIEISDTHLVTLFRRHVGVSPKLFQRIMRFSSAVSAIQRQERINWADVSAECGYYDQPHFIRDFIAFSGFQPTEFLARGDDRANFFPDAPDAPDVPDADS